MNLKMLLSLLFVSSLVVLPEVQAARQIVTCSNSGSGHKAILNFNPAIQLMNNSVKSVITKGSQDSGNTTTAVVNVTIPKTKGEFLGYSGSFDLINYYSVNHKENNGYSYKFNGQPYRTFHGNTKDDKIDMEVYIPDAIVGKESSSFNGLMVYQPSYLDEGYYHIDLVCSSKITN